MRAFLASLVLIFVSSLASAEPAKTPEQLLPADCVAYFRYDGYAVHRKAYDQTALAKAMREGLGDFLDHAFSQLLTLGGEEALPKGEGRRQTADRFLEYVWNHGFVVTAELVPARQEPTHVGDLLQLTVVFPYGANKKNQPALEGFLRLAAGALGAEIADVKHGGRRGRTFSLGELEMHWWPEGEHLLLTIGTQPVERSLRVLDGRRPNLTSTKWYPDLTGFQRYETDMRGYVNLEAVVDRLAIFGLEERNLANLKERFARQVLLSHLGLTGLKDLTFHLGFDGPYQRSTVRLGVAEPDKRAGLLQLISGPAAFDAKKLPSLPPDTDYVSVRHVDWADVFDYARTTYGMMIVARLFNGELPERFPDLDRALGIDFRKDFLEQLDTTLVSWGAHSEGPFFLGQGFAVKVKDAVKVRKSLDMAVKSLGAKTPTLATERKRYRGHEMHIFSRLPMPLTATVCDDWLVVGLFPQPVQGFVLRSSGKYRTWKAPQQVTVALDKQSKDKGKLLGVSVSDPRPAVEIGLSVLPALVQAANQMAGLKLLDVGEIPNAQSINEWLFPNITLCYDDGNALRMEHLYSMNEPDDFLLVQALPYVAEFLDFAPLRLPGRDGLMPRGGEKVPVPRDDPKAPIPCRATAFETEGVVEIQVVLTRQVPYSETRWIEETVPKTVVVNGKARTVNETRKRAVTETRIKTVEETRQFSVDGKTVRVTRKDGKAVDPKELPNLLQKETQVLLVRQNEIDPAVLEKLDKETLILRVAP